MSDSNPPHDSDLFVQLERVWFQDILRYGNKFEESVKRRTLEGDGDRRRYSIYTNDHVYSIVAVIAADGHTYLGCTASTRKARAGEEHTRGNDLPDGKFTHDTWLMIVQAIVGYELVPLAKKREPRIEDKQEGVDEEHKG